ncbi:hypothetical protein PoB_007288500 [Plakobranchus ocellatus]|uniref:Uncharacterized protein n=1 Tax=Plakobranchus ocellatus TaxID=259542 RepID=A0AAV4DQP7_9GAST|nr:hypothetical protein PoB_007288500 [Plakobranchus ocellatus]
MLHLVPLCVGVGLDTSVWAGFSFNNKSPIERYRHYSYSRRITALMKTRYKFNICNGQWIRHGDLSTSMGVKQPALVDSNAPHCPLTRAQSLGLIWTACPAHKPRSEDVNPQYRSASTDQ